MKSRIFSLSLVLLVTALAMPAHAQSDARPPSSRAASTDPVQQELDHALTALTLQRPPPGTAGADHYRWFDSLTRRMGADAFAFIEKHPDDPRRWRAAWVLVQRRFHPRFVISIGDDYATAGENAVVRDTAAEAAWSLRVDALEKELRAASDVPDEIREQVEFGDLMRIFQPAYQAAFEEKTVDVTKVDTAFREFLARWPKSQSGRGTLPMLVGLLKKAKGTEEAVVLAEYAESPNAPAREYVRDRRRFFELSEKPFELAFTALDGRAVDLQAWRGKVVLIDFWATWCGPCIAELPNVKKIYADYHDKGFEIIGVSLDSERDRQKFIDLVAKEEVTWPQRFEGKGWQDRLALDYTISGIPAMFLLDQEGKLVSTNARGPKLESEVKRLLKL